MARKKSNPESATAQQTNDTPQANGTPGESVAGYFRKVFQENPKLLKATSNQEIYDRWLADHPDQTTVPDNVKASLSNLKSVLRSAQTRRKAARAEEAAAPVEAVPNSTPEVNPLEMLEEAIDECLALAKHIDREHLESIIGHLRAARNEVVWKLG